MKAKYLIGAAIICTFIVTGCKKDFFNRPPENEITIDNFYQNDSQVAASTNNLYNSVWFDYITTPTWGIADIMGGNGRTYAANLIDFQQFTVSNNNPVVESAWLSLWTVVEQANALINYMPAKVSSSVTPEVLNNALGEAHFMRAMAYFHLVRLWGPVPIVENGSDFVGNFQVNTNRVEDIYKFMINDMKFAETNCTAMIRTGSTTQGHVSSGSASAMLAKIYLYMQDYTDALAEAQKVIKSGEFKLYGVDVPGKTFNDLFKTANNNNEESICQLQWVGGSAYGHGDPLQANLAFENAITGTGDGYGACGPTVDLVKLYDTYDTRLHGTLMMPGDFYPEITAATGGFTVPATVNDAGGDAAVKKYVVGTPADNGGLGAAQSAANNTYLMRYAEVYLIAAEAIVGNSTTSTDPQALAYINVIRERAGLSKDTVINRNHLVNNPAYDPTYNPSAAPQIIQDDILSERRREFAIENDYWFDLCRLDGWQGILNNQHPKAISIISTQERGIYATDRITIYHQSYTPSNANFLLPIPVTESTADPKLLDAPVAYVFK